MEKYAGSLSSCAMSVTAKHKRNTTEAAVRGRRITRSLAECSSDKRRGSWRSTVPAASADQESSSVVRWSDGEFRPVSCRSVRCDRSRRPRPRLHFPCGSARGKSWRETQGLDPPRERQANPQVRRERYPVLQSRSCTATTFSRPQTAQRRRCSDRSPQNCLRERGKCQPQAACKDIGTA